MTEKLKLPILLLISDNPSIRDWFKNFFVDQFYIIEGTRRSDALAAVQYNELQFIVLDSHFEECEPLELARELRKINTVTPILLITGRLKKTFRDSAIQSGITDFLNDELTVDEVQTCIAAGRNTEISRKKTADLSMHIKDSQQTLSQDFFKNKMLLNEKALHLLAETQKQNESIALLLIRIDHFSELQNRVHLLEIDELFLLLSNRLHQILHPEDLLIPSSQGLFILLLPHTLIDLAHKIAEELRRVVQQEPFTLQGQTLPLTISIAISPLNAGETEYKRMLNLATHALQQSHTMTNLIISLDKESS